MSGDKDCVYRVSIMCILPWVWEQHLGRTFKSRLCFDEREPIIQGFEEGMLRGNVNNREIEGCGHMHQVRSSRLSLTV